jgi:hypothetical protein
MLKKYKQTGKILSVQKLKEVKGGTGQQADAMFAQSCGENEDCTNFCYPGKARGTFCLGGLCRNIYC